jgi:hypothetical protein
MVFEDREEGPEDTIAALAFYPDDLDHSATSSAIFPPLEQCTWSAGSAARSRFLFRKNGIY